MLACSLLYNVEQKDLLKDLRLCMGTLEEDTLKKAFEL